MRRRPVLYVSCLKPPDAKSCSLTKIATPLEANCPDCRDIKKTLQDAKWAEDWIELIVCIELETCYRRALMLL